MPAIPVEPRPPGPVTAAAVLLYCAAGAYVLAAVTSLIQPSAGLSYPVVLTAAVFQVGLAVLFGLVAFHARAGSRNARTGAYVLAGLATCGLCARAFSDSDAGQSSASTVIAVVFVVLVLSAVILLSIPAANRYFRDATRARALRTGVRTSNPGPW